MAYQVLARKWRPQDFHAMVGQEHVLQTLMHALDHNRLHHAYLFAGTRGVGKTTIARILARCLNCEQGVRATPCGACTSCVEISEGRFVDLLEVDAASRTRVEDTRELLENVQYAPTRGRFKVYLIDEVHMLSNHSFNALLKTLEEPPPHVKFLLATTEPHKLPVTVLSRCLQFNLKSMPVEQLAGQLQHILACEHISFEAAALWLLGRAAEGSMRDALSLTDQAIGYCGGELTEVAVRRMLGTLDQGLVVALATALHNSDAKGLLQQVEQVVEQGFDVAAVLDDLLSLLHQVAVQQVVAGASVSSQFMPAQVKQLAASMNAADVQLFYQIGLQARKDLPLAPDLRNGLEMALLRMLAFRPQQAAEQLLPPLAGDNITSAIVAELEPAVPPPVGTAETMWAKQPQGPVAADPPIPASVAHELTEVSTIAVNAQPPNHIDDLPPWEETPVNCLAAPCDPVQPPAASSVTSGVPAIQPQSESGQPLVAVASTTSRNMGARDWTLEDISDASWPDILNSLSLEGMTRNIAVNMIFAQRTVNQLTFTLATSCSSMLTMTHQDRIRESLETLFGCELQVSINIGELHAPTPYQQLQEQRQKTVALLQADPLVQDLLAAFDGQLDETSVQLCHISVDR